MKASSTVIGGRIALYSQTDSGNLVQNPVFGRATIGGHRITMQSV